jgi:O-glycosyl hydrolase
VQTTGKIKGVRVMSFKTPEGGIVAQVMNSNNVGAEVSLRHKGKTLHLTAPAHSISTAMW